MKKYIIITADTNDGDYVSEKTEVTDQDLAEILPVIDAIKAFNGTETYGHNFACGQCVERDQKSAEELYGHLEGFKAFYDIKPYSEYGIHTIVKIEILTVVEELRLL